MIFNAEILRAEGEDGMKLIWCRNIQKLLDKNTKFFKNESVENGVVNITYSPIIETNLITIRVTI
jgi:hypothetical protein